MKHLTINGANVTCPKGMKRKEAEEYVKYIKNKYPKQHLLILNIKLTDDGHADLYSTFEKIPFERIRRITGYLTGDTSTWNSAKKAELAERVKHTTKEV